jgi:hypothetical protein
VIALPQELAPWGGLLGLFSPDLAGEVGRMLPLLALAVGPMRAALPVSGGEPDGFSGIARRGSYERLLLTEWLLADEAPEEFARRAAMGEHAFFHLARRSPTRAASSVAIFDSGPEQIGAPRIAHLAALIVLAARAERAGARFAWGILGAPDGALTPTVTAQSVLGLLGARTAVAADAGDVAAWADRAARSGWEDAWLVGRGVVADGWKHATLEIRDVLDPERRALAVIARTPRAPPREVELALPDPAASVRLLRDPFAVIAPAPRRQQSGTAPASNLVFALNGTKLFARSGVGEILAYPVPNSPRDVVGRVRRYRPRTPGVVAAVGWIKRGLAMATVTGDGIVLEHTGARGPHLLRRTVPSYRAHVNEIAVPFLSDPLSPLVYRAEDKRGEEVEEVFFLDARRALVHLRIDPWTGITPGSRDDVAVDVKLAASEVAALGTSPTRMVFVGRNTDPTWGMRPGVSRDPTRTYPPGEVPALDGCWYLVDVRFDGQGSTSEELLGDGSFQAAVGLGLVAVQQHGEVWAVHGASAPPVLLTPPASATVVGVSRSGTGSGPELVLLEGDRRTLSLAGRSSSRSLPRASAPIVDVTVNAWRTQLAYVTSTGEVVVHSLHEETPLARFLPEG